jgi:hypothetical protein
MLRAMAEQSGFADPTIFKDLAGLDRVLAARPRNP